jgi:hypothetical protein
MSGGGQLMPAKGRGGALLRNDEFVDKVYRILEMICEARGATGGAVLDSPVGLDRRVDR